MENKDTSDFLRNVYAIELTDYLKTLGIIPTRETGQHAFFPSPFGSHPQHHLHIDKLSNRFHDSALQKSGTIIEFGMAYHGCTLPDFLTLIKEKYPFKNAPVSALETLVPDQDLSILSEKPEITDVNLQQFLRELRIPLAVANLYCKQLQFAYYGEKFNGIGFPNNSGGYAIIRPGRDLHTDPPNISVIPGRSSKLDLYQNFTDFLSIAKLRDSVIKENNSVAILHDLALFESSRPFIEQHSQVNMFLHHSPEGRKFTAYAEWLDKNKYRDFSQRYHKHQSITAWCVDTAREQKEQRKINHKRKL